MLEPTIETRSTPILEGILEANADDYLNKIKWLIVQLELESTLFTPN